MSTVTRPRGPLPPRVYWVRRLLVLVVALGLVFAVAHLLGRGGGGADGPSAQPVGSDASTTRPARASTADAQPQATPSATPRTKKRGTAKAKATTPTRTPLATPSGPCEDDDVVALPSVRGGRAYAGRSVVFTITLTTRTSPACTWDVSAGSLVVRLTSGSDRIWSTQECHGAVPKQSLVVRRDHPATVAVGWNGQRSDSDCTRTTAWAQPGYYHVTAAAYGSEPDDEQFELHSPPRPTITATPSPKHKKKG